jgi:MFS family permease
MPGVSNYAIAVILCLQTLSTGLSSTIGQYIYAFYLQTYPNSSNSTTIEFFDNQTNTCAHNGTSPDGDAQLWAQQRSANLFFWTNLVSSCPMIIMTYLLGLYTSKLGKRVVLLLPIIGCTGQVVIWLAIIYFHLPEFWWYIAAFIIGLSGSSGIFGRNL